MRYGETIDFLFNSLPVFEQKGAGAYKPGVERVVEFARRCDNPQNKFLSLHIAGTNGKGSTSHMLAAIFQAAGYRTGLYTSPHLLDFRERIRVDGKVITKQAVVDFTARHREMMVETGMTFFEMATVMAFDWFARQQVDISIVETGLGGRLDATNIITPLVSVITNIGIEHTQYLGDTIPLIAAEKAGIIKTGVPVVIGEGDALSAPVFKAKAIDRSSTILFADARYRIETLSPALYRVVDIENEGTNVAERLVELDLAGEYQRKNLATVLTAIDVVRKTERFNISEDAVTQGLLHVASLTGLFGRWQVFGEHPLIVCDTAHNAHGMAQVTGQIKVQKYDKLYMVLGFVADKDLDAIIPLLPHDAHYIFTQAGVGRAMSVEVLCSKFAAHGIRGESVISCRQAVVKALGLASKGDMVYIGGSNFTVAEALPALTKK